MEYSAATASLFVGPIVFVIPHFLIGLIALLCTLKRISIFTEMPGTVGLVVQGMFGALFFGLACITIFNSITETYLCRGLEAQGKYRAIEGIVRIESRFAKPGYAYTNFKIGNESFKTYEGGVSCDCGLILPLGKKIKLKEGMYVRAKVQDEKILSLFVDESFNLPLHPDPKAGQ